MMLIPEILTKIVQLILVVVISLIVDTETFALWSKQFAELQSYAYLITFIPAIYFIYRLDNFLLAYLSQLCAAVLFVFVMEDDLIPLMVVCMLALISNGWLSVLTTFSNVKLVNLFYSTVIAVPVMLILFYLSDNPRLAVPIVIFFLFLANFTFSKFNVELPQKISHTSKLKNVFGFIALLPNKYLSWLFPMLLFAATEPTLAYLGIFVAISASINNLIVLYLQRGKFGLAQRKRLLLMWVLKCSECAVIAIFSISVYNIPATLVLSYSVFALARFMQLTHRIKITTGQAKFSWFDFGTLAIFPVMYVSANHISPTTYYFIVTIVVATMTLFANGVSNRA